MGLQPTVAEEDTYDLPPGEGREDVLIYCGACHSLGLVVQQGLTRSDWADLLQWMYEEQGMSKLTPEEEKRVLDYLAENVGPAQQKQAIAHEPEDQESRIFQTVRARRELG